MDDDKLFAIIGFILLAGALILLVLTLLGYQIIHQNFVINL